MSLRFQEIPELSTVPLQRNHPRHALHVRKNTFPEVVAQGENITHKNALGGRYLWIGSGCRSDRLDQLHAQRAIPLQAVGKAVPSPRG